jgi:hypothetical protein
MTGGRDHCSTVLYKPVRILGRDLWTQSLLNNVLLIGFLAPFPSPEWKLRYGNDSSVSLEILKEPQKVLEVNRLQGSIHVCSK